MATFTHRDIVTRRREYVVPAPQPWGACYGEIAKAVSAAWADLCERRGMSTSGSMSDDALRFFPGDDEIIISFEIEETP